MKKKSLSRSVQHGCPSHPASVEPVRQGDFMFSAPWAGICRKRQQLWVSCHTHFAKPRWVRALQTLVFTLVQITLVHWLGKMTEAGGFKVCVGLWQTGSPVLACQPTGGVGKARRMSGMCGRLEKEKNVRMEHALAYSSQRYCQRLIHFPNKPTSLTVMLTEHAPFFFPLWHWICLIHGLKNTGLLPDMWHACHSSYWCQNSGFFCFS